MLRIVLLFFALFSSACAVGPLVSHDVGHSAGYRGTNVQLMSLNSQLWGVKVDYGVTDDFDLGVQWEVLSLGFRAKYAFINRPQHGLSLAGFLGIGSSFGGSYRNLGLATSYRFNRTFEPFASIRWTSVEADEEDLDDGDTEDVFNGLPNERYSYTQIFVGTKIWFNHKLGLSIEAGSFFAEEDVEFEEGLIYSLALDLKL
jgi:hypothetical protein